MPEVHVRRTAARRAVVSALLLPILWQGLALPPVSAARPAEPADPRFEPLRQAMKRVSTEHRLPSLSVAVAKDGKVVFEEAIGWADVERRVPAAPDIPYALGGVTQAVTATAVMTLVDRGKLALDHAADDYLDARAKLTVYEGRPADVTLRRLLTHTAGLPPHRQLFYEGAGELPPAARTTIRRYGIVVAPPGEACVDSNIGYSILGSLAARTVKKDYAELVNANVLTPLGLSRTVLAGARGAQGAAVAYDEDLGPLPPFGTDHMAASAVHSSVHDLVRFGMFHLRDHLPDQQAILKDETILEMQKSVVPAEADGPGAFRGLGWAIRESDYGYRRVEQTGGSFPGATAHLALIPQEDVAVAVLANRHRPAAAAEIVDQALGILLPRFGAALAAKPRVAPPDEKPPARFAPEPALQGSWEGVLQTWDSPIPLTLTVEPGGAVRVKLGTQPDASLSEPRFQGGLFTGRVEGVTIPSADARRRKHVVELALKPRGSRLSGWASAVLQEGRPYGSLASRVELWRPGTRPSPTPTPSPSPTPRGRPEDQNGTMAFRLAAMPLLTTTSETALSPRITRYFPPNQSWISLM
jgi:CubicO group peptidase (beta-lactamase class C family)